MIILTKIYSSNKKRKEKINEKFLKIYYKTVISDLFKENKDTELEETDNVYKYRHKRFAKSDLYKELIINTFIHVHYQTIGKIRLKTESMMNDLHYEKLIRSYLYSPFYKQKKLALNTISEFKITGYEKYLIKLAKQKKNKLLHTEALITLIRLNVYNNLIILTNININFSIWDINMIIRNIEKDKELNIPYNELINACNEGMQLLGIMLTRIHHKKEFKKKIKKKTENENSNIKVEAILTFASFSEKKDDFDFLLNKYPEISDKTKNDIIKIVDVNPNKKQALDFFEWIAENEPIPSKLIAIENLLSLDISKVFKLKQSKDISIKMACEQVLDINN